MYTDYQVFTRLNQVNNTLLKKRDKSKITFALFVNDWFIEDCHRKQMFRYCPCTCAFVYNPHLKSHGLKLEYSKKFPWFSMLYWLYDHYILEFWFRSIGFPPYEEIDEPEVPEISRFNLFKFLKEYVQKRQKNRVRIRRS